MDISSYQAGGPLFVEVDGEQVELELEDFDVKEEAYGDLVLRSESDYLVAIDPTIDEKLKAEGWARELINRIQRFRKDSGLLITDRIGVGLSGSEPIVHAAQEHSDFICSETLTIDWKILSESDCDGKYENVKSVEIDDFRVKIGLNKIDLNDSPY